MDEVDAETDALEQVLALSLQEAKDREREASWVLSEIDNTIKFKMGAFASATCGNITKYRCFEGWVRTANFEIMRFSKL